MYYIKLHNTWRQLMNNIIQRHYWDLTFLAPTGSLDERMLSVRALLFSKNLEGVLETSMLDVKGHFRV